MGAGSSLLACLEHASHEPHCNASGASAFAAVCLRSQALRRAVRNLAWAAFLAACSPAPAAPVAAEDATGATIALAAPARRIVSLAPHATELLFAAGAGDRVVG